MKAEVRRQGIMDMLVRNGMVTIEAMAERFAVSRMTIHRDLDEMEVSGLLRRVRGGATIAASQAFMVDFSVRQRQAIEEKERIAAHCAGLIEPGQAILVDDGSTAAALGEVIATKAPLTVITNNLYIIQRLTPVAGIDLIALGGEYSRKFNGFFGLLAETALQGLRADAAFISCSGVHGSKGFHQDQEVVQSKRLKMAAADRRYLLVDHMKFGRHALHFLADLEGFDAIVTSQAPPEDHAAQLQEAGVRVEIAPKTSAISAA